MILYFYPQNQVPSRKGELLLADGIKRSVALVPGSNELTEDEYKWVQKHPYYALLKESEAVVVGGTIEKPTMSQLSATNAIEKVKTSNDEAELEAWLEEENRRKPKRSKTVIAQIEDRLAQLAKKKEPKKHPPVEDIQITKVA